jgi:hypothetical protein
MQRRVLGGTLVFILMTKLPGIRIERIELFSRKERDELRESYKQAWQYVPVYMRSNSIPPG